MRSRPTPIGGGHLIAQFPDKVSGAAALFDLLLRLYVGLSLKDALTKWSGGNGIESYIAIVSKRTGLKSTDKLSRAYRAQIASLRGKIEKLSSHLENGEKGALAKECKALSYTFQGIEGLVEPAQWQRT